MKRMVATIVPALALAFCMMLAGCGGGSEASSTSNPSGTTGELSASGGTSTSSSEDEASSAANSVEEESVVDLSFSLDGTKVEVAWEDNEAVLALKALTAAGPIEIALSPYGGFEQVGPIGSTLPRDDIRMTTAPGDIVLYAGNQISIFSASNTWEYTKLGSITGMSDAELADLLSGDGHTLALQAK